MKTTDLIKPLLLTVVAILAMSSSCEREEPPYIMPPETTTGANTFGWYVNDVLYTSYYKQGLNWMGGNTTASYNSDSDELMLYLRCNEGKGNTGIYGR
ncbi:hypothetical protein FACS1894201_03860 [Bacteroidia bacterium]|nr:hypothetical protein FACS1894201_03860 [Bacteroidia bacterium]